MKSKLPQVSSATAWFLSAASLLALAGCGPLLNGEDIEPDEGVVTLPESFSAGNLYLVGEEGTRIHIGDPTSLAQQAFPKPKKSFAITTVPNGLEEKLQVYGWENISRSFGVLTQKGRIALALDVMEKAPEQAIQTKVEAAMKEFGEPVAIYAAGKVQYWFWESDQVRMMYCAAPDERGRVAFSMAIGYPPLMDHFRMSPGAASEDRVTAERLLSQPKIEK